MIDNRFYTYAYLRKGDRTPYYIGKGTGKRAYDSHRVKVPDDRDRIIFLKENVSEKEAWDYEREMIQFYGRKDLGTGILRNLSDGGEGPANPSPENRRKNSERNKKAYADGTNPLSRFTYEERIEYGKIAAKARMEGQWLKDNPEYNGGSLGRTSEQHSVDSAKAAQSGIVKWTKDKWENDPEWAAEKREKSRQTALKNIELGIGIAALTTEQRSANTKALFEGEDGEERKEFYRQKSKREFELGIGCYSEEAKQKRHESFYKNGKNFDEFTVVSPWGETISDKGVKPFARKHGIPMETFRALIKGDTPKINGWTLPGYDEYQVLNLCREGKTREEIEEIVGYGIRYLSEHFPTPKEDHKYCYCCFEELPLSDFNKDKSRFDGLRERCRKCTMDPKEWNMRKLREKGLKTCLTCEKVLPFSEFHVNKTRCKSCVSIKNKKITEEKHKKIIEKNEHKDCVYCGKPFLITPTTGKKIFCSRICKDRDKNSRRVKKRPTFPPAKEGYKWCTRCKQELPFSEFWKDKDKKDGYATQCKCCKT